MRWGAFLAVTSVGAAAVGSGARNDADPATIALPVATVLLGAWLCFLFEDAAATMTAASPTPLALRRAVRGAIAVAAVGAVWVGYTWLGPLDGPTGPMTWSFGAIVLVALGAAAAWTRVVGAARAALPATASLVTVVIVAPVAVSILLERRASIDPATPPVGTPGSYWATVAAVAVVILLLGHLDLARPPIVRFGRRRVFVPRRGAPAVLRSSR
ncbi:MAG: hypothetical protein OEV60_01770 [Actinomycetota bacterium]|nr:hypothetical protein [Actinomycetota bacterium]MDH5224678.1 hypothetical protein [Actinomycetota bacterium]MDH5312345.1 hypothetical protein [Actinomycetota bacterium]